MVNETMVDDHNEKRIQELEATNAMILDTLERARRYLEYNVAATETNGKLLYSIRSTLANVKGTAR